MSRLFQLFLCILSCACCFVIDCLMPLLLSEVISTPFLVTSHFVLIFLLICVRRSEASGLYLIFLMVGIAHDSFHFQSIPVASICYPLLVFIAKRHKGLLSMSVTASLMLIVFIFIFDVSAFGMAWLYKLTRLPLSAFITYNLMPTLIFNLFVILAVNGLYHYFYKRQ